MAEKTKWCSSKSLSKKINYKNNVVKIYLHRSWDVKHGYGWFSHSYFESFKVGFGFHQTNKFTAVRQSLNIT